MGDRLPSFEEAAGRAVEAVSRPAAEPDDYHVGAELRDARRRLGVDLETAASDLNIRADYLIGLERNDHAALPGLAYAIGFVRSYATYVGLDPGKMARRFREETSKSPVKQDYTWLKPIEQSRISRGLVLVLSLAIAGSAYTAWYYRTADVRKPAAAADAAIIRGAAPVAAARADEAGKTAGTVRPPGSGVYSDEDAGADTTAPPARDDNAGLPASARPDGTLEDGAGAQREVETAALPPGTSVSAPSGDTARPGPDAARDPEPQSTVATPAPTPTPAPTIILKALGLSWIRVRDPKTGRVVVEGIMKPGNEITLPDEAGLVLDAGRPNQIEFSIGGKSAGLAGTTAAVRHDISLDPARLVRNTAAAATRETAAPEAGSAQAGAGNAETGNPGAQTVATGRRVVLRALGLVWIRVRDPRTGRVVVEGIMKQGNEVTLPDDPGLVLDAGRPNQLEFSIGGKSAGLAGASAAVRHNISLDPARLVRNTAAAATQEMPAPEAGSGRADTANEEGGNPEPQAAASDGTIVLRALDLVWIRVRHPQTRRVVVEGILKKGNVVKVPDDPGLVLDVGRANQIEYRIDGKSAGLAGESPGPVHNLSLDPARLKRGG